MGFFLIFVIIDFFPTTIPLCGPPNNLSPEKVITDDPDLTTSPTTILVGIPFSERSKISPQPKSTMTDILFFFPRQTSSSIRTSFVNPEIV